MPELGRGIVVVASDVIATGPMLVIRGQIHPKISEDGPSKKLRNGIGVRDPNTVLIAISDGPVSFGAFARLFRDGLACPDALFLDGSISGLYDPAKVQAPSLSPPSDSFRSDSSWVPIVSDGGSWHRTVATEWPLHSRWPTQAGELRAARSCKGPCSGAVSRPHFLILRWSLLPHSTSDCIWFHL